MMSDKCFYCERKFIPENYGTNMSCAQTIDHVIPISRRGNNTPENKVDACIECNSLKASMLLDEFKEVVEILILTKRDYYKTISKELFYTIIKNIFILKKYVEKMGSSLYLNKYERKKKQIPNTDEIIPLSENIKSLLKTTPTKKKKRSLVGEHLERKKLLESSVSDSATLTKRMQQAYGFDFNKKKEIGFFDNPILLEREIKEVAEKNLFLMHQTKEQFELAKKHGWVIAKMLTEPEPNFHIDQQ